MANERLMFPLGFDLESGVRQATALWKSTYYKQLQNAISKTPLKANIVLDTKGLDISRLQQFNNVSREAAINAKHWSRVERENIAVLERKQLAEERVAAASERTRAATARRMRAERSLNGVYATQTNYLNRLIQRMGIYMGFRLGGSFLRNIREVTAQFELQRVALGSIIGDINEANSMFEQIKAAAVKSPFEIKDLVTYTKQLAAYKIETEELFSTTQRLADISAGLGVGMDRLVLAYGQIRATGYLRASEVRQLTEAGIPIVEELAKKMSDLRGETVLASEVMGLISERAISFGMVKDVFDDMTSAGGMFYKMQEEQAETLAGQWSNLKDSVSIMYDEMGNTEGVSNAMKGLISAIKSLANNWRTVGAIIKTLGVSYLTYLAIVKKAAIASKALTTAEAARLFTQRATTAYMPKFLASTKLATSLTRAYRIAVIKSATATGVLSKAFWTLSKALLANPFAWVIAVLASIAMLIASVESKTKRLNKELNKIGTEGAVQADQSVRNFERLAKVIRESVDGSVEQSDALAELKRSYGDLLPSREEDIKALIREKEGYEDVTNAIREKIGAQIYEQKMNAVVSDFSKRFDKKQKKPKKILEISGFSSSEISNVFDAINKAVQEGLITTEDSITEGARKIEILIEEETGKLPNFTQQHARAFMNLVEVYSDYNDKINELTESQKKAGNLTWEYQQRYDALQDSIKKVNEGLDARKFADKQKMQQNALEEYRKEIQELIDAELGKGAFKVDAGQIIDFEKGKATLAKLPANLRAYIKEIQKAYEKLIPTDITRLANQKLEEYATQVGISMDLVQEHLKTNEKSTADWAEGLKSAYETAEKKLAEYQKIQEEHNKPYFSYVFPDVSSKIEEVSKEMQVLKLLLDFFKEFLKTNNGSRRKSTLSILQEELQLHEKIYAKYKEYRQYMKDEEAKTKVEDYFKDTIKELKFKPLFDDDGYKKVLEQYRKSIETLLSKTKDATEKSAIKKVLLEIGFKVDDIDWQDEKDKIEKELGELSRKISHTKTAKDFFENMLNLTGDRELSATLTMKVFGVDSDKIVDDMYAQLKDEASKVFGDLDISEAFNDATKQIDYSMLMGMLDKVTDKYKDSARKFVDNGIQSNAKWLNDLYKTYQKSFTFEERRAKVRKQAEDDIADVQTKGFHDAEKQASAIAAIQAKRAKDLANIDLEEFKQGSDYTKMFDDLEKVATPTISRLLDELKMFIDGHKDLPVDQIKALMNLYQKLYDETIKRSPFKAITDGIDEYIEASKRVANTKKNLLLVKGTEDEELIAKAEREVTDALDEQAKAWQKTQLAVQTASDMFDSAANQVNELATALGFTEDSDVSIFLDSMSKAFSSLAAAIALADFTTKLFDATTKAFAASNPIGWILLVAGAIVGAISAISNAKVRNADKEIEELARKLEDLQYAYGRLEKEQEDAFGTDYINNYKRRLANLEAQEKAYLKQAKEERAKGKKADEEKIRDYEDAARDAKDAIEDMQTELSEHFLGTDLTSAARDFASAWIDAYKSFGNTTEAMKEKFKDMIQSMITESLIAKVMERALKPVFEMIDQMDETDFYSSSFWSDLMTEMEKASENGVVGATNVMSMLEQMGINLRDAGEGMTGISRDIATASEESILGLAAGINTQNFYISQVPPKLDTIINLLRGGSQVVQSDISTQDLFTLQNQYLSHLPTIAQHTAETVEQCKMIVVETKRTADALDKVIKTRGVTPSHTLHTTLSK